MLSPDYPTTFKTVFGLNAKSIKSEFGKYAQDEDFIPVLGKMRPKPILFGCDISMSRTPVELEALSTSRLTYVLAGNNLVQFTFPEQVWRVIRFWPEIMNELDAQPEQILRVDFVRRAIQRVPYL